MEKPHETPQYNYKQLIQMDSAEIVDEVIRRVEAEIMRHAPLKDHTDADNDIHNKLKSVLEDLEMLSSALGKNSAVEASSRERIQESVKNSDHIYRLFGGQY